MANSSPGSPGNPKNEFSGGKKTPLRGNVTHGATGLLEKPAQEAWKSKKHVFWEGCFFFANTGSKTSNN